MDRKIRRIILKFKVQLDRLLADKAVLCFFVAFAVLCINYRIWLSSSLLFGQSAPLGFEAGVPSASALLKSSASDLLVAFGVVLGYFALHRLVRRFKFITAGKWFAPFEATLAAGVLLAFSLLMLTHYRLIFEIESGVNMMFLELGTSQLGVKSIAHLLSVPDVVFLIVPLVAFGLAKLFPAFFRRHASGGLIALGFFALATQLQFWASPIARELSRNPVHFLVHDVLRAPLQFYFGDPNAFANRVDLPGADQMNSLKFIDEAFVSEEPPNAPPARMLPQPPDARPWNILFFVLESVGTDYVFDETEGEMPMPFLRSMADEGLYFANHRSTCNSSVRALFSIFSGLYPRPTREQFLLSKNISLPLMNRYLSSSYKNFLIHPSSFKYSYPIDLFTNNGITEQYCYENLPKGPNPEHTGIARNEIDAVSFLMKKLDATKEPFFGVYWSFIPHHPYSDYGEEYQIRPPKRSRDRYYNNLRTLDVQLRRVVDHLRETKLLDRTILVFVGDHGEAFGQHPGVFAHAVGTFGETFRAPLIIYQPRLVEPQVVNSLSSHVDIVPTLFDMMGLAWDESRFQGESVFRESRRKYIFQMDALADYMTAIDAQMNKISIGFEHGNVFAYNLAKDPGEKIPLAYDRFTPHLDAILKFRNYQNQILPSFNSAIIGGMDFRNGPASKTENKKTATGG